LWPFKKKFLPLESIPIEDLWSVGRGPIDGTPMIVQRNTSAETYARHPDLPIRLGIAIPIHLPDERGYANQVESKQLEAIEDRLCAALGPAGRLVLVITGGGMKEFVSYVRSAPLAERVVAKVREETKSHEVQYYVQEDRKWRVFSEFEF